jgi:hypothetical protein
VAESGLLQQFAKLSDVVKGVPEVQILSFSPRTFMHSCHSGLMGQSAKLLFVGSNPTECFLFPRSSTVEHPAFNRGVTGAAPVEGTLFLWECSSIGSELLIVNQIRGGSSPSTPAFS